MVISLEGGCTCTPYGGRVVEWRWGGSRAELVPRLSYDDASRMYEQDLMSQGVQAAA